MNINIKILQEVEYNPVKITSKICITFVFIYFVEMVSYFTLQSYLNPLDPHGALKHHSTSLKTDLILLQLGF